MGNKQGLYRLGELINLQKNYCFTETYISNINYNENLINKTAIRIILSTIHWITVRLEVIIT